MKSRLTFLLLTLPIVAGLAVPLYNRVTPTLGGWPFFYGWQTACVLAVVLAWSVLSVRFRAGEVQRDLPL
ncbi:DUF3311 domain-containing protein [Trinickia mobilis]|uniref:DUF3311 domain-containing protein n=1 Tax=Trinickia mobilis TaxID=2816356 RepID=UPI001A8F1335|nr:DUF3311 domain-containing protein [Trinickia mobilis]